MQIAKDRVVTINYVLSDDEDNIIDSSDEDGPLTYLHGHGNIVPGLESALEGKGAGDTVHVTLSPELGYGELDPSMVRELPLSHFDELDEELEVGMQFEAETDTGEPIIVTVTEVEGDQVTVDGNHPLAGMSLSFDVEVVSVREATDDELRHGHVHDDDDDHDHGHEH